MKTVIELRDEAIKEDKNPEFYFYQKLEEATDEIQRLNNIIEKATNEIQYIIDYGFDYDGFNTVESLKSLIDMLVDYARKSKDILNGGDLDE